MNIDSIPRESVGDIDDYDDYEYDLPSMSLPLDEVVSTIHLFPEFVIWPPGGLAAHRLHSHFRAGPGGQCAHPGGSRKSEPGEVLGIDDDTSVLQLNSVSTH